ncbi:TadE family protein [Microbacterium sp. B2969]|uniref:TadE family protein n=1 Tax=Microbacterium alkaliflavum TaxID=3248839 RepID=A0ABW7QDP7_9MICO
MSRLAAFRTTVRFPHGENERGSAAVEAIIILPVVFLIIFGIIQGAVVMQANNVAQAAASTAYNAARLYNGTSEDGVSAGDAVLTQAGTILAGTNVVVQRAPESVTVTVSGTAASLIPGVPLTVSRTVTGPTERWVGP